MAFSYDFKQKSSNGWVFSWVFVQMGKTEPCPRSIAVIVVFLILVNAMVIQF